VSKKKGLGILGRPSQAVLQHGDVFWNVKFLFCLDSSYSLCKVIDHKIFFYWFTSSRKNQPNSNFAETGIFCTWIWKLNVLCSLVIKLHCGQLALLKDGAVALPKLSASVCLGLYTKGLMHHLASWLQEDSVVCLE
jgi:hypothetical protein